MRVPVRAVDPIDRLERRLLLKLLGAVREEARRDALQRIELHQHRVHGLFAVAAPPEFWELEKDSVLDFPIDFHL